MIDNRLKRAKTSWQIWQRNAAQGLINYHRQTGSHVRRLVLLAWIAIVGMPLYYLVWAYWFPQPYENLALRLFGMILCIPAIFAQRFAQKKWLPVYAFAGLTYVLPFFFTFMYLMNDGSAVWSQSLLIALILLFHFDTLMAFFAYLLGTALAYLAYGIWHESGFQLSIHILQQWPIQIFAILTVSLAKIGRKVLSTEKLAGMATALATVAHELRTPLRSVAANARGMKRIFQNEPDFSRTEKEKVEQALERIHFEVRHMNSVIDLFLLSASTTNRNLQPKELLSVAAAIESMLQRYPFISEAQRALVNVTVRTDFHFYGQSELFSMVLFNLLRNALNALHRAGKGRVHVMVDGKHFRPKLLFIDTGCGIDTRHLSYIFKRFYSYPEHTGTGIGLAFCKEVIEAWNTTIRCVTRAGAYTIFVLEFPVDTQKKSAER